MKMESAFPAPLTPDQRAAVAAGGGYARCEDPSTHVVYHLIQQSEPFTIDDDYLRQKLDEAYRDIERNGMAPLDMAAVKAEFERRLAASSNKSG